MTSPKPADGLIAALERVRELASTADFPLVTATAERARNEAKALQAQLDDYVLPRLRALDAPVLAVVGGSTGAGKSTLVNSVLGRAVTESGVLRPTTRSPVLVHAPADAEWFSGPRILPGMPRTMNAGDAPASLRLVSDPDLTPGLAVLDTPDIDSVVRENRELAAELLAAADLWLFVTTAARYADAVPWDLLRTAAQRSAAIAVVLDRVPAEAMTDVSAHLGDMLRAQGLGHAPLFVIPETTTAHGLLPEKAVAPVRDWLRDLAADATARAEVIRRTLDGALDSFRTRIPQLADALTEQSAVADRLRAGVDESYAKALKDVDNALRDGTLLRGEVLARWQEFIGTGELLRNLESGLGRLRDRLVAAVRGRPQPGQQLEAALEVGVEALVRAEADGAAEAAYTRWENDEAGRALLADTKHLDRASPELQEKAAALVREWQTGVLDLVRSEGQNKRSSARFLSYGVNGAGLVVMVAVFASTGGLTGTEVVVAGGTSALSQKLLEALLGDQAVRTLAEKARADLRRRLTALLDDEADRYRALVHESTVTPDDLVAAGRAVELAR